MDGMKVEILEDGRIKVTTDSFSPTLHTTAEAFLNDIFRLCGGKVERESRKGKPHVHHHTHGEGETHDHVHH
jgi:hypothetical protein